MFCYWYGWMIFAHGCLLRCDSYHPTQLTCFCGISQHFTKNTKMRDMKNTVGNLLIVATPELIVRLAIFIFLLRRSA